MNCNPKRVWSDQLLGIKNVLKCHVSYPQLLPWSQEQILLYVMYSIRSQGCESLAEASFLWAASTSHFKILWTNLNTWFSLQKELRAGVSSHSMAFHLNFNLWTRNPNYLSSRKRKCKNVMVGGYMGKKSLNVIRKKIQSNQKHLNFGQLKRNW